MTFYERTSSSLFFFFDDDDDEKRTTMMMIVITDIMVGKDHRAHCVSRQQSSV